MTTILKPNQGEERLYMYKRGALGGFFTKFFDCVFHADTGNQTRLKSAFPEEVEAVQRYQNESGYWDELQDRIRIYHAIT